MNNNYENSNYLCNYYDSNYYNSFNQTNDKRFDSLYENYMNSYQNFDYKIASNIASNYRHCGSGWYPNYGYPQTGHNSYYEPNYSFNRLDPMNTMQTYQTLPSVEVDSYQTSNHFSYNPNEIQSNNYLEKSEKGLQSFRSGFDNYIPLTVEEVEKQIKTEKEFDEILSNGTQDLQMDCFQRPEGVLLIEDNGSQQSFEHKENDSLVDNSIIEMQSTSKPPIRRKNRKHMTYEELKREKRESNRLAATKCRLKKLQQLDELEKRSKLLIEENNKLEQRLNGMKAHVFEKKMSLIHHRNSGCLINAFGT